MMIPEPRTSPRDATALVNINTAIPKVCLSSGNLTHFGPLFFFFRSLRHAMIPTKKIGGENVVRLHRTTDMEVHQ